MTNLDFNYFCKDCKQTSSYRAANCFVSYVIRRFEKGEYIALTGERVRCLALLVSGSITVSFVVASGLVIRSTLHSAPYPIGALAVLGRENRYRVDVVANEACEVIFVGREDVERQIMSCREFMLSFYDYSTSKLDHFVEQLTLLSQRSLAAKLAYYIFVCSTDLGEYEFTKSIAQLADYLCVERPSLSRVIAKFTREGYITYRAGRGKIVNIDGLKGFIE